MNKEPLSHEQVEQRAVLSSVLRRHLGVDRYMREDAREMMKYFIQKYEDKYEDILPLNRKQGTMYMKRALVWCADDSKELKKVVDFVFAHWDEIKAELNWDGRPSISLFGSADIFHRIKIFVKDGFRKSEVKARFVKDDSPSKGW